MVKRFNFKRDPSYDFKFYQLRLQIDCLKHLYQITEQPEEIKFQTLVQIQKEINDIKRFLRFHQLHISIEEIINLCTNTDQ